METVEKQQCTYNGQDYPHGAEVDERERRLVCINGKWVSKDDLVSQGC